ncbi:8-oxo-dGTP diphosphatase [Patescibacteria group bacterium]|nr:8-oxo-dGTP diphosphatase [Patescibacteria group bacterium]MBU1721950.1 8-oxo-dGTP diphosphatase [Patescibacteria group bacterium]MBU1901771.1 8-oxo-dGTP diphosphatase [Patescibacteria group bacterium]
MKLATVCYITKDGKTLMLHRNTRKGDIHEGKWVGIGGKFDEEESPEECIIREVKEETNLDIKNPKLCGILSSYNFKGADWMIFVFSSTDCKGELSSCAEGTLEWIPNEELHNLNLWEDNKRFLPLIDEDKFFSMKTIYKGTDKEEITLSIH